MSRSPLILGPQGPEPVPLEVVRRIPPPGPRLPFWGRRHSPAGKHGAIIVRVYEQGNTLSIASHPNYAHLEIELLGPFRELEDAVEKARLWPGELGRTLKLENERDDYPMLRVIYHRRPFDWISARPGDSVEEMHPKWPRTKGDARLRFRLAYPGGWHDDRESVLESLPDRYGTPTPSRWYASTYDSKGDNDAHDSRGWMALYYQSEPGSQRITERRFLGYWNSREDAEEACNADYNDRIRRGIERAPVKKKPVPKAK